MTESIQHKLSRVRPPRVQITYDVEIGDALEKKELPFVIGMMADLSGNPAEPLERFADRKFVDIDRDNFNEVLGAATPRLTMRVPNKLQPDSDDSLNVELNFKTFDDFAPDRVIEQVPALATLFEARKRLRDLLTKLDGNDALDALLVDIVANSEQQEELKKLIAAESPAAGDEEGGDDKTVKDDKKAKKAKKAD